jgi:hypothetical protein
MRAIDPEQLFEQRAAISMFGDKGNGQRQSVKAPLPHIATVQVVSAVERHLPTCT